MKKLFTNYNFDFDKNERKLLKTFCRQTLKQIAGNSRFFAEEKSFNSIIQKLETENGTIKLTKEERNKLFNQLKHNVDFLSKEIRKSGFIKRWFYKSLFKQYDNLIENHFKG